MAASDFAKTYHESAEALLRRLLNELPGLPLELRDAESPQFEVALSFSMGKKSMHRALTPFLFRTLWSFCPIKGHVLHHSMMDVEADRVAADAESVCEKMLMSGHARKATKLKAAITALETVSGVRRKKHAASERSSNNTLSCI